jgi:hypothetical protein
METYALAASDQPATAFCAGTRDKLVVVIG